MKKVIYLFILMFIPIMVLADASGPSIIRYDAIISNKKGAKDIGNNKNISYDTKISVYDEYKDEGKTYVRACIIKNNKNDECDEVTILASDIMPLKDEYIPTDKDAKDDDISIVKLFNKKIIVFEEKGIKLRKGPSEAYKEYDVTVPYKTFLTAKYAVYNYEGDSTFYTWYYVADNDYTGWIGVSGSHIAYLMDEIIVATNTNLYNSSGAIIGSIKSETVFKDMYYLENNDKYSYYLQYNNEDAYIKGMNYGYALSNIKVYTLKDANIISIDGQKRIKVPVATTLKVLYGFVGEGIDGIYIDENKNYFYVEYNGVKGFISNDAVEPLYNNTKKTMVLNYELEMYDYPSQKANKLNKVVPAGTQITTPYYYSEIIWNENETEYRDWYLITYNGTTGWIKLKDINKTDNPKTDNNNKNNTPTNTNHVEVNKENNNILLYCLIGAGVLCLTGIVTIILVNKKRKNKSNNKSEDKQVIVSNEKAVEKREDKVKEKA